ELKNGKVIFKQKPISLEKNSETLQEIIKFREMLESRAGAGNNALNEIPQDYYSLIAKLAHESDRSLHILAKYIIALLMPDKEEEEDDGESQHALPSVTHNAIENAIQTVANRVNYGLDAPENCKAPTAVCIWRWEIRDQFRQYLPKNVRDKAEHRLSERVQAKNDLADMFSVLPEDQRCVILHIKSLQDKAALTCASTAVALSTGASLPQTDKDTKDTLTTSQDQTKVAKKFVKLEKQKKEQASQDKSRSLMANFFTKRKTSSPVASSSQTDFERTFKPFLRKKDTMVAPQNWFQQRLQLGRSGQPGDEIVFDLESQQTSVSEAQIDLANLSVAQRLRQIVRLLPPPPSPRYMPPRTKNGFKTPRPSSVRECMERLTEAEIAGDTSAVRILTAQLRDRTLFPAKVLIFSTDTRPGYFGTWTRGSRTIGPRSPLARDQVEFDYGYDSGEDWAEDQEDADDVFNDEDDAPNDEVDSDLDSWLVDDDEVEGEISSIREGSLDDIEIDDSVFRKRKAEDDNKMAQKKRKIVPLAPYAKGPCWEERIGHCSFLPFEPYRIQLFNDAPFPIDPFTFVSTCREEYNASRRQPTKNNTFLVPALPSHITASAGIPSRQLAPPDFNALGAPIPKKPALVPKKPFPDACLQYLLSRIISLRSSALTLLVETIYQELHTKFEQEIREGRLSVTKVATEAKIREVAEKCKERKTWVLKAGVVYPAVLNVPQSTGSDPSGDILSGTTTPVPS
ncbi:hypothetical protein FISHEDRAFT_38332, partial [Fistulina hepatica ATCC 64428]